MYYRNEFHPIGRGEEKHECRASCSLGSGDNLCSSWLEAASSQLNLSAPTKSLNKGEGGFEQFNAFCWIIKTEGDLRKGFLEQRSATNTRVPERASGRKFPS